MTPRPPVVLVGLDCPTGLQTARIFYERGIEVIGLATYASHPCARTNSCARIVQVPSGDGALVETLVRLGTQLGQRAVLVPCADLAVLEVARNQTELGMLYRFAVPEPDVTQLLLDKASFAKFATIHEFPIPRTFVVTRGSDMETAAAEIEYPCVLKPSVKSVAWSTNTATKALVIDSPKTLLDSYERFKPWADAFVVQEWIAGTDEDHYTCDCYVSAQGVPLVTFSARKIRQWPPGTGQGCLSVECRDDYVRDLTLRVLATAGHHGQGYLETKRDTRSGRHLIVEANIGRPTGRAAAAERAGVELLMTMYCDLIGAPLPTARTQKYVGTKWIHIRRDLQASAHLMLTGRAGVRDIVKPLKGPFAFALLSRRDPVPFFADWAYSATQFARSRWATTRSSLARRKWLRWLSPGVPREAVEGDGSTAVVGPPRAEQADFDIDGVVRVRTRDAWPADLAAIARHLGRGVRPLSGDPDVIVCFTDDLTPHVLERIEGEVAFGDDGIFLLSHASERPLAHMRLSEPWGAALIVCRRGLGKVPLLSMAIDLAALHHEWVPMRATTWTVNGASVLLVPDRSTMTSSFVSSDCLRPVPEGRLLLAPDGKKAVRMGKPPTFGTLSKSELGDGAHIDAVALLEAHDRSEVVVERIDTDAAAGRLSASVGGEIQARLLLRDPPAAHLAGRGWTSARRAPGVATRLLREATRWKPCFVVRHPESCPPEVLADAIAPVLIEARVSADRRVQDTPDVRTNRRRSQPGSGASERAREHEQSGG